jgi:subtilisin family serine protease
VEDHVEQLKGRGVEERVIVLRVSERTRRGDARGAGKPTEIAIEAESVDRDEWSDLLADQDVEATSLEMPTSLIEPHATDESSAEPGNSWGIDAVQASQSTYTGEEVIVAVLDTGIDGDHPAFSGVTVVPNDFTGTGPGDRRGHGTHCAGTIVGRDVDGVRIGIARGVTRLLDGKVLPDKGYGTSKMLFEGIQWAAQEGANIIAMSLGFDFPGMVAEGVSRGIEPDLATSRALEAYRGNLRMFDALMQLMQRTPAYRFDGVIVAAAGNESKRDVRTDYVIGASLPAAAEGVISVGAIGRDGDGFAVGAFSNGRPTISAPGIGITSAKLGGGLAQKTGTSMACPHVAGVAALWFERARTGGAPTDPELVRGVLLGNARTDVFHPRFNRVDHGVGLATAPR